MSVSDLNTTADRRRCRKHGDSHIRRRSYRDLTNTRRYLSTAQRIMIQSRTSIQLPFPSSRGFDSRPFRFQTTTLAGCTQRCASVTKQYNLVPVKGRWRHAAGKVTVGLASHRPRVTDFSGLSTYGLTELSMGWVDPWVGSGWVEIFQFLVSWVGLGPLQQKY